MRYGTLESRLHQTFWTGLPSWTLDMHLGYTVLSSGLLTTLNSTAVNFQNNHIRKILALNGSFFAVYIYSSFSFSFLLRYHGEYENGIAVQERRRGVGGFQKVLISTTDKHSSEPHVLFFHFSLSTSSSEMSADGKKYWNRSLVGLRLKY